jgi:hypothetical protein
MFSCIGKFVKYIIQSTKSLLSHFTKIQNIAKLKVQLDVLALGLNIFGKQTKLELFGDAANVAVSVAKTIQTIMDGQPEDKRAAFIGALNEAKGGLTTLKVGFDTNTGVNVKIGGIGGSYNPLNGVGKIETEWKF